MLDMIIKVCGLKNPDNIAQIRELDIDWMGMIFYPNSPRHVTEALDGVSFNGKERIGVFVNESVDSIRNAIFRYGLTMIQLHGDEPPGFCDQIRRLGMKVVKAVPLYAQEDLGAVASYEGTVDYILLDTKTKVKGGSGQKFDWSLLNHYDSSLPFLLSGGIGPDDVEDILLVEHPRLCGVDLNSQFELEPGLKNVELLRGFVERLRKSGYEV